MRAAILIAGLALSAPALAEPYDIPWFKQHPVERREVMRRCEADVALAQSRICGNARRAGAAELGEPLAPMPPDPWMRSAPPAPPPAPMPEVQPAKRAPRAT
jgi:hypothetical protein